MAGWIFVSAKKLPLMTQMVVEMNGACENVCYQYLRSSRVPSFGQAHILVTKKPPVPGRWVFWSHFKGCSMAEQ